MVSVYYFIQTAGYLALAFVGIGLIKPVIAVWFCATVNRQAVLRIYGTAALVLLSISFLIRQTLL